MNPSGVRLGSVNTNLPPDDVMAAALGRQIAAERVAAGMSQTKLAELIGIHKNSLIRYENADRDMPWTSIEAVARALGLKTSALVLAAEERAERMLVQRDEPGQGRFTPGEERGAPAQKGETPS